MTALTTLGPQASAHTGNRTHSWNAKVSMPIAAYAHKNHRAIAEPITPNAEEEDTAAGSSCRRCARWPPRGLHPGFGPAVRPLHVSPERCVFDLDFSSSGSTQRFGDHFGHGHAAVLACNAATCHHVSLLSEKSAGRA